MASDTAPQSRALVASPGDRSIGAICIDAGRLSPEQAERVLRLQREEGLRFGDAAIRLGVLTPADIEFALARQFEFPYTIRGKNPFNADVVAASAPFSRQAEAFRGVRTQLMLRWFDGNPARKMLAIVSTDHADGRSFVAANLAVAFAQLSERTLLVDTDLRNSCQHRWFGVDNRVGLSALLSGRGGLQSIQAIAEFPKLSLLPSGASPPNPAELLSRPAFGDLCAALTDAFDIVIFDTPPAAVSVDAQIIGARTGAALLVARKDATPASRLQSLASGLRELKTAVVGTLLNEL